MGNCPCPSPPRQEDEYNVVPVFGSTDNGGPCCGFIVANESRPENSALSDVRYNDPDAIIAHKVTLKLKDLNAASQDALCPVHTKQLSGLIGLRIGKDYYDKPVMVKTVHYDGAADKSGIKAGWEVVQINGEDAGKMGPLALETAVCGPLDLHFLKMQSILDVMDDFRSQVPLLHVYFENHSSFDAKVSALATKAAEIDKKPDLADSFKVNVASNLKAIEPLSKNVSNVLRLIIKYLDGWKFDATGLVNSPPKLSNPEEIELELTQADLNSVHTLCYIHYPSFFHDHSTFLGLTGSLCRGIPHAEKPIAIITVGPPGSGKSFMIGSDNGLVRYLQEKHAGPPLSSFVEIDPDYWITNLADNDNARRPLCNMLNLENFFFSLNQRYNLIFGGTGKDIKNTCGRVTARLKQAGYRIYYAIVLSTYEVCMKRIADRFEKTGRNVPDFIVKALFQGLQESVPVYLKNQVELCDEILIYTNNTSTSMPEPTILKAGQDPTQALELVKMTLALPADGDAPSSNTNKR